MSLNESIIQPEEATQNEMSPKSEIEESAEFTTGTSTPAVDPGMSQEEVAAIGAIPKNKTDEDSEPVIRKVSLASDTSDYNDRPMPVKTTSSLSTSNMDFSNHSSSSLRSISGYKSVKSDFLKGGSSRRLSELSKNVKRANSFLRDNSSVSLGPDDDVSETAASTQSIRSSLSIRSSTGESSVGSIVTSMLRAARECSDRPTSVICCETPEAKAVSDVRLAHLVRIMCSRSKGIPDQYKKGNSLARRMSEIFTFPKDRAPDWLWKPVFQGLLEGTQSLDNYITPPGGSQPMPILTWLCQWKTLQALFYWKGNHDMVSMMLGAGADPNLRLKNGATPIFFAVKYGCIETVKLLVEYGADLTIKDRKGRSCLWNALERPQPEIIRYLLEVGHLPACERFPYNKSNRRKMCYQTAMDYLFAAQLSLAFDAKSNPEYPWSWQLLGEPSEESVAEIMIEFGSRGVSFTPGDITLSLLSFVLRGDDPNRRQYRYPNYPAAKGRLERLAKLMIGRWLPESWRDRVKNLSTSKIEAQNVCMICMEDMTITSRPRVRLYCGHDFCLGCILGRGNGTNVDLTCPVCHKILCLSFTGSASRRSECLSTIYGEWNGCHGPNALTSEQLRAECQARDITTRLRNDENLRSLLEASMNKTAYHGMEKFDLNTNVHITDGENDISLLRPVGGPVALPIIVCGVPVIAFISVTSSVTLLSSEFVQLFGLRKVGIQSETLKNLLSFPSSNGVQSIVEEFQFKIGEINICLRNALESPLPSCIGVQLGLDFLQSGAWCVIDAKIEDNLKQVEGIKPNVSIDGFGHVWHKNSARKEELRYYSNDGEIFRTGLLHLQPFKKASLSNWINVVFGDDVKECNWCSRVFPDGLIACKDCEAKEGKNVYYCTDKCKEADTGAH